MALAMTTIRGPAAGAGGARAAEPARLRAQRRAGTGDRVFDRFVVGKPNELAHAAGKDQQWMLEMAPLQKKWRERAAAAREAGRRDLRLEEIRWMLEELRVSLFAQQLGTAYPVSVKRIETRWRELGL